MNDEPTLKVRANGTKEWRLHGKLHRENAPAIEYSNGAKFWYLHGKLHREDGAAIEHADGTKLWYLHDELHREDGAAIEFSNGDKEWWWHDKWYATAEAWAEALLTLQNKPNDDANVDAFLKQVMKKSINQAL